MALYEYFDGNGDTGMLVGGVGSLDMTFRKQADAVGHADQRLLDVHDPRDLLDKESLQLAAAGALAGRVAMPSAERIIEAA